MAVIFLLVCIGALYSVNTNAATITSVNSGPWETGSNWDSGTPPTSADDVQIVNNGISLSSNVTVNSLVIDATVNYSNTGFSIGSGYTLTVTGDVTIIGNFDAASEIVCAGNLIIGGDLHLNGETGGNEARVNMGNNSSITLYGQIFKLDFGRIFTAPTTNVYTLNLLGSTSRTLPVSQMVYHHIVVNTSGVITMGGAVSATNVYGSINITNGTLNNGGFAMVGRSGNTFTVGSGGTYQMTGTTALPTVFNMVVASTSTINYGGSTQTIGALNNSQTYGNLTIGGSGTKTLGANTTVRGNLNISAGTLDVSNTNNYSLTVGGNFINSATFTARAGSVTFNGTSAQSITSNASTFYNATFNNSNISGITLNDNMTVTNGITFTDGVVNTGINRLSIENTSASAISGYSSNSFVNGRLRRYITTNTSTYAFPVGNGVASNNYHLAEIINNNMTGVSYIDSRYGALTNHNDGDMTASDSYMTYLSVAPAGVWHLTPNAQPGGSYDVRLNLTNMGIFTDNQFGILKRNDGSTSGADWSAPGTMNGDNGAGRLIADGYALRMGLASFSEFGIGRASTNGNPLPIELVSFTAQPNAEKQVVLNWTTALEINNDYFTIERSTDGVNFEEVALVNGAGNSQQENTYSTVDAAPVSGLSYYRLKQTDFDGGFEYSGMVNVTIGVAEPTAEITVYPNPANTGQQVQINIANSDAKFTVEIYEIGSGRLVYNAETASQNHLLDVPDGLAAGAYLVRIANNVEVQNHKLLVR